MSTAESDATPPVRPLPQPHVLPAQAGISPRLSEIPASAGMTDESAEAVGGFGGQGLPARSRRWGVVLGVVTLLVAAATAAAILVWKPAALAQEATAAVAEPVTAAVELTTLVDQVRLGGQLGYGDPVPLPVAGGMLTALPASGQRVKVGEPLYERDGLPVVLLRGKRPLWRELGPGVSDGPDVKQLEQNLKQLGYFTQQPDERFSWRTRQAIRAWQRALGVPRTGSVAATDAVMVDAKSVRVAQVTAKLGDREVSPFSYTATRLRVRANLTAAQASQLQVGTPATVRLPDGSEAGATVTAVDPGGQPQGEEGKPAPPSAVVDLDDLASLAGVSPGSVRVTLASTEQSQETLVVPVTAILATPNGGYAVELPGPEGRLRVPVELGLVADARAQVLASGSEVDGAPAGIRPLQAGDQVVIG